MTGDYADQDRIFEAAFNVLRQGLGARAFPGAATAVTHRGRLIALRSFGRFTYEPDSPTIQRETIFDLASLTKVVATTTMAMMLYERGVLDLDAPVVSVLPEFRTEEWHRDEVTVRMLLAHTSGLPAYARLFEKAKTREEMILAAARTVLAAPPGTRVEYSDIGFIVLGELLQRLAAEGLDSFCYREIFGPLQMLRTSWVPPSAWRSTIPPTEDDRAWRGRVIQGEVNDENASVMDGIAGHAGAFANAEDLARFAEMILAGGPPILRPETVKLFTTSRYGAPGGPLHALGWDIPTPPSQAGRHLSPSSIGHLGFTGTSLWIDPERHISVSLLTNRTWPDRQSQGIKNVRPRFHDAVMEALHSL